MYITDDIKYIGVNDHEIDLFEGQYKVPNGMSYNSYLIIDDKLAVMDSVDINFKDEWFKNIDEELKGKNPDYLIVQHMESDHSSSIYEFMKRYPNAYVVSNIKAFTMMQNFFNTAFEERRIIVKENDKLKLGKHELTFVEAPMVHWPEVMMSYDSCSKIMFTADAFGKFGALDIEEDWLSEARRYYIGIVGKFGKMVLNLLKKVEALDIEILAPLHGPVLKDNLSYYLDLYKTWASYEKEKDGIVICYTSVYGNTRKAVELLIEKLKENSCEVITYDLARSDMSEVVSNAFVYNKLVLATTTYNADIFPFMKEFINHLIERGFTKHTIGIIENGSWAPMAAKIIKESLAKQTELDFIDPIITIKSSISNQNIIEIEQLAKELSFKK